MLQPWKLPPDIKIYEALGAIGDGRVEIAGSGARVYSSSRQKFYEVTYQSETRAIMANDNGSYWQGYIGYPAMAYLMMTGVIPFDVKDTLSLKGFDWQYINRANNNDWNKSIRQITGEISKRDPEFELDELEEAVAAIRQKLVELNFSRLGPRARPPAGD